MPATVSSNVARCICMLHSARHISYVLHTLSLNPLIPRFSQLTFSQFSAESPDRGATFASENVQPGVSPSENDCIDPSWMTQNQIIKRVGRLCWCVSRSRENMPQHPRHGCADRLVTWTVQAVVTLGTWRCHRLKLSRVNRDAHTHTHNVWSMPFKGMRRRMSLNTNQSFIIRFFYFLNLINYSSSREKYFMLTCFWKMVLTRETTKTRGRVTGNIILAVHRPAFPGVVALTFLFLFRIMILQAQKGMSYIKPAHSGTSPLQFPGHQISLQLSSSSFFLPVLFGLLNDNLE